MATRNANNVYKGTDSLRDYFDPDQQPMIPMVELPVKLNPFYDDGVRIYAKMMSTLPANNVKSLPGMFDYVVYSQIEVIKADVMGSLEHVAEFGKARHQDHRRVQFGVDCHLNVAHRSGPLRDH
jgi:hypothetical protein